MAIAIIQTTLPDDPDCWHGQDMLLALASVDLNPQLILSGHGLSLWHKDFDVERNHRSLHKRYRLLELYDCPAPWVLDTELADRAWQLSDFIAPVEVIDRLELHERLQGLQKVLRY